MFSHGYYKIVSGPMVYIYLSIYIYMYICTYIYIYLSIYLSISVYIYIYIRTWLKDSELVKAKKSRIVLTAAVFMGIC